MLDDPRLREEDGLAPERDLLLGDSSRSADELPWRARDEALALGEALADALAAGEALAAAEEPRPAVAEGEALVDAAAVADGVTDGLTEAPGDAAVLAALL